MFTTLFGMLQSMFNEARGVPMLLRRGIWAEASRDATDMRNYLVSYKNEKSSYEKFMGEKYDCINTLHTFGEKWQLLKIMLLTACEQSSETVASLQCL
jgi:hypothetical protein